MIRVIRTAEDKISTDSVTQCPGDGGISCFTDVYNSLVSVKKLHLIAESFVMVV